MATKSLATHLADILTGKRESSADELRRAKMEANARLDEIEKRLRVIGDGGKVRHRVEIEGMPADLRALDSEIADLEAERKQLRARAKELNARAKKAKVAEAKASHKASQRDLNKAVEAVESAHAQYRQKVAAADAIVSRVHNARNLAGQIDPAAVEALKFDRAMLERLAPHVTRQGRGPDRQARSDQFDYIRENCAREAAPSRPRGPQAPAKGAQA